MLAKIIDSEPQVSTYCIKRRIRDAITNFIGSLCALFRLPGFVRNIDYADKVTGDYIQIRVGRRFTIISVNGRDYWFRRFTGVFSGTGYAYCVPIEESLDCILGHIQILTPPLSLWGRLKQVFRPRG